MRVFVAGGTGVVGRRLVPQLVARGHRVTATTTGEAKLGALEKLGAQAVVMDGLDAASVGEAVAKTRPDVIVHQMTGISLAHAGRPDLKHFDRWSLPTIRLRTGDRSPAGGCRGDWRFSFRRAGLRQLERYPRGWLGEN